MQAPRPRGAQATRAAAAEAVTGSRLLRAPGCCPPELVGTHVGPPVSHTTGRMTDLDLRCLTALFGHAGIEWDVSSCSEQERQRLRGWVALHQRLRPLLHGGRTGRDEVRLGGVAAAQPAWCSGQGVVVSGRVLAQHGLAMPVLDPGAGVLLEVSAGQ